LRSYVKFEYLTGFSKVYFLKLHGKEVSGKRVNVIPFNPLPWQSQLALCTAALLPELQPAPCFLSAIIGRID